MPDVVLGAAVASVVYSMAAVYRAATSRPGETQNRLTHAALASLAYACAAGALLGIRHLLVGGFL